MCFHFQCANELKNERQFLFASFAFRLVQCTTKIIITNNKMELCDKKSRRQRKGQKERERVVHTKKETNQTNKLTKMICGISLVLWRKCRAFVAICWNCICCIKSLLTKKKYGFCLLFHPSDEQIYRTLMAQNHRITQKLMIMETVIWLASFKHITFNMQTYMLYRNVYTNIKNNVGH